MRDRLIELLCDGTAKTETCDLHQDCATSKGDCRFCTIIADHLLANGVTVQDRLPIDDAILILREELKQRVDGYATHLSYGGKGDPAEEAHIDALEMAIAALERQRLALPQPPKGE